MKKKTVDLTYFVTKLLKHWQLPVESDGGWHDTGHISHQVSTGLLKFVCRHPYLNVHNSRNGSLLAMIIVNNQEINHSYMFSSILNCFNR